ncbi:MAG: drug/metabolite transporter (DMT)-like permease [Gammaproteobacteria bacterium]|jgi:drug/metabolite transporter (DMT)-like permease
MQKDNIRAAILVVIATTAITTNDAIFKHISQVFNVGQVMALRGLLICVIFAVWLSIKKQPVFSRQALNRWNLTRAFLELLATLAFLTGLTLLPIATTITLSFVSPIILAILASFILGEQVSLTRWAVIACGFSGVILITDPFGANMEWAVVLPLICAFLVALRDLAIRKIPSQIPSLQLAFTNAWVVMLGGVALSLFQEWHLPEYSWYLWFLALAVALCTGYLCYIIGSRIGELSFIAPFKYVSIALAILYGYLIWGDIPSLNMIGGAIIIFLSGIYLIRHERKLIKTLSSSD